MPTNEERRGVANNLRGGFDVIKEGRYYQLNGTLCGMGIYALSEQSLRGGLRNLADLIDPEPERTCMGFISETTCEWICEICGGSIQGAVFKPDIDAFTDEPNYCPFCGAKVVE